MARCGHFRAFGFSVLSPKRNTLLEASRDDFAGSALVLLGRWCLDEAP